MIGFETLIRMLMLRHHSMTIGGFSPVHARLARGDGTGVRRRAMTGGAPLGNRAPAVSREVPK